MKPTLKYKRVHLIHNAVNQYLHKLWWGVGEAPTRKEMHSDRHVFLSSTNQSSEPWIPAPAVPTAERPPLSLIQRLYSCCWAVLQPLPGVLDLCLSKLQVKTGTSSGE